MKKRGTTPRSKGFRICGKDAKAKSQGAKAMGFRITNTKSKKLAQTHFSDRTANAVKMRQAERERFVCPLLREAREAGTARRTMAKKVGLVAPALLMGERICANLHNPNENRPNPNARQRISPRISGRTRLNGEKNRMNCGK